MIKKHQQPNPRRERHFACSPTKAALILGVGKTSIYHLISMGALWMVTVGNRRLVPLSALKGFIESAADSPQRRGRGWSGRAPRARA
jgi:excisionase family DNA binding protein